MLPRATGGSIITQGCSIREIYPISTHYSHAHTHTHAHLHAHLHTHTHTHTHLTECDFIVHRKCEQMVVIDCSSRLESDLLSHDRQVENVERIAAEGGDDVCTRIKGL